MPRTDNKKKSPPANGSRAASNDTLSGAGPLMASGQSVSINSNEMDTDTQPSLLSDQSPLQTIRRKMERWGSFLNNTVGILALNLSISCQGSEFRVLNSLISLIVVMSFASSKRNLFPPELKALKAKEMKSPQETQLLKYFEHTYLRVFPSVKKFPVYYIGIFHLIISMSYYYAKFLRIL